MKQRQHGFSLVETLVVLAIISILMALYLPVLNKAMAKARDVAAKEGMRQSYIGKAADDANGGQKGSLPDRAECRAAFRTTISTGKQEAICTQMLYAAATDEEFEAYWNTLINPNASGPLEFDGRNVYVETFSGQGFYLPCIDDLGLPSSRIGSFPVAWTYISTNLGDTSSGNRGGDVLYSTGNVNYVAYPGPYPMTRTVAELSYEFLHP